jgi:GntR family transcriptional regulator, transcriptional repressor for pyruvate dehydrogenase complex
MVRPSPNAALVERVVARVREMINEGDVKPGERLPPERELARQFGINRSGLRAGFHLLKAMGVIEARIGSGTYVSLAPPVLEREPLSLLAPLQAFSAQETFLARRLLEVGLAGLAARNATEDDLASLAEEVTEMYVSIDNRPEYLVHDIRFHRALAMAARNSVLATLMDMVSAVLYEARRETVQRARDLRPSVEMHRKIYRAVRSHNVDEARAAMCEHLILTEHDICLQNQAR